MTTAPGPEGDFGTPAEEIGDISPAAEVPRALFADILRRIVMSRLAAIYDSGRFF